MRSIKGRSAPDTSSMVIRLRIAAGLVKRRPQSTQPPKKATRPTREPTYRATGRVLGEMIFGYLFSPLSRRFASVAALSWILRGLASGFLCAWTVSTPLSSSASIAFGSIVSPSATLKR